MVITIHQPEHLPWMGLLNKISKAEKFVILDSVQFEKNYFQNRNRIMGTNGVQWINVPTATKGHMGRTIAETEISFDGANAKWRDKYLRTIQMSYGKHPYFKEVYPTLEQIINTDTNLLSEINIGIIKWFCSSIGIDVEYVRSKDLDLQGEKSDLILDICRATDADVYIAGPSGRDYLDEDSFKKSNIEIRYNDYVHPEYPQMKSKEFISHLSALDIFMNCGFNEAGRIIKEG